MARRPRIQTVFDYSYDGVMRSFEDSLQRLGVNRVDVLLIHDLDPSDHNPAALNAYLTQLKTSGWKALAELREAGVIGGIGGGFNSKESLPRFLDLFDMDFFLLAMRYTLLEQDVLESEFPAARSGASGSSSGEATIPAFSRPAPFRAPCTIMRPPAPRSWSG